jgi:hypothetical protein
VSGEDPDPPLAFEERSQLPDNFGACFVGQAVGELRPACAPVQTLDVICENDTFNGEIRRKRDLEGISLGATRDRAEQAKSCLPVVRPRRDGDRGTAATLLVTRLGVESYPDDVPTVRNVGLGQLPDFPACRWARLYLGMAVPLRDLRQELVQIPLRARGSNSQLALLQEDLDLR